MLRCDLEREQVNTMLHVGVRKMNENEKKKKKSRRLCLG